MTWRTYTIRPLTAEEQASHKEMGLRCWGRGCQKWPTHQAEYHYHASDGVLETGARKLCGPCVKMLEEKKRWRTGVSRKVKV